MEANKDAAEEAKQAGINALERKDWPGAERMFAKCQSLNPDVTGVDALLQICKVNTANEKLLPHELHDWYAVLQVQPAADGSMIKKQYRKLSLQLHPDKNRHPGAEDAFKAISDANAKLSDEVQRRQYNNSYKVSIAKQKNGWKPPPPKRPAPWPASYRPPAYVPPQPLMYDVKCPHCQAALRITPQGGQFHRIYQCANCNQQFEVNVPQPPPQPQPQFNPYGGPYGGPFGGTFGGYRPQQRPPPQPRQPKEKKPKPEPKPKPPPKSKAKKKRKRGDSESESDFEESDDEWAEYRNGGNPDATRARGSSSRPNAAKKYKEESEEEEEDGEPTKMEVPDSDFHDFDSDRTAEDIKTGEIWAMFDDEGLPRWMCYIKVAKVEPSFEAQLAWFQQELPTDKRRRFKSGTWRRQARKSDGVITSEDCACFKVAEGDYKVTDVDKDGVPKAFEFIPKTGQVWAINRDESIMFCKILTDWDVEEGKCEYVELERLERYNFIFKPMTDASGQVKRDSINDLQYFSHYCPKRELATMDEEFRPTDISAECVEIDPSVFPNEIIEQLTKLKKEREERDRAGTTEADPSTEPTECADGTHTAPAPTAAEASAGTQADPVDLDRSAQAQAPAPAQENKEVEIVD